MTISNPNSKDVQSTPKPSMENAGVKGLDLSMVLIEEDANALVRTEVDIKLGQANKIKTLAGKKYRVINAQKFSDNQIEILQDQVVAVKRGKDLELAYPNGTSIQLLDFYRAAQTSPSGEGASVVSLPSDAGSIEILSSERASGAIEVAMGRDTTFLYAHGDEATLLEIAQGNDALTHAIVAQSTPITELTTSRPNSSLGWVGGLGALVGGGAPMAPSSVASTAPEVAIAPTTISGVVVAGPVLPMNGLKVLAFKADGVLLESAYVDASGHYKLSYAASYTGAVLLKVVDTNSGNDYMDEAKQIAMPLNSNIYAIAVPTAGIDTVVNISPLTSFAAKLIGIEATPLNAEGGDRVTGISTASYVASVNIAVAKKFAGTGINSEKQITQLLPITTITDAGEVQAGDVHGISLAGISGMELSNNKTTDQVIDMLLFGVTVRLSDSTLVNMPMFPLLFDGGIKEFNSTHLSDGILTFTEAQAGINLRATLSSEWLVGQHLELRLDAAAFGVPKDVVLSAADISAGVIDLAVSSSELGLAGIKSISIAAKDGSVIGATSNAIVFTWDATPITVNNAPVLTPSATHLLYTEQGTATAINADLTVADVDSANLTGATVTISIGLTAGDLLAVATQNGISGTYDGGTGVLALSGTATVAQYQVALRSVTYSSTSDDPTASSATRTISWGATDGTTAPVVGTSTIDITAVNDPSILVVDTNIVNEDSPATGNVLTNDSDVDNSLTVSSFTVDGHTYSAGNSAYTIDGVGTIMLKGDGAYTFTPDASWNGTVPTITYTTNTGSTSTLDITVTPVNDAPTITVSANSFTEDAVGTVDGAVAATYALLDQDNLGSELTVSFAVGANDAGYYRLGTGTDLGKVFLTTAGAEYVNAGHSLPVVSLVVTDLGALTGTGAGTPSVTLVNDAPTITVSANSFTEDAVGTVDGAVAATYALLDQDNLGSELTVSFAVGANDAGYYRLGTGTDLGKVFLTTAGAEYVNAGHSLPVVSLVVTDLGALTGTGAGTPSVTLVNDAPTITVSANSFTEDAVGTVDGAVAATYALLDQDNLGSELTVSFAVGANDAGYYRLGTGTDLGKVFLTTAGAEYVNAGHSLPVVSLVVTDLGALTGTGAGTPSVTLVNDAPTITVSANSFTEDAVGTVDGAVAATYALLDQDNLGSELTVSFAVGANDAGYYRLGTGTDLGKVFLTTAGAEYVNAGHSLPVVSLVVTDLGALTGTGAGTPSVTLVNDAPVLDAAQSPVLTIVAEGAGVPGGTVGTLVSSLVKGITDVDESAVQGIAITATNATNGTLYYSKNGGTTWTAVGDVSDTSALLLASDANTRVYYAPTANYNGTTTDALTIRAWDQTSGSAGTKVNVSTNGLTTAFSTATDTVAITVVVTILQLASIGTTSPGFAINGAGASDQSGISVSSAGDVNGDGLADLIVGAPGDDASPGKSFVIFGRTGNTKVELSAMASTDGFVINGAGASDYSGNNVSSAGDVNGDGLADLIVGVPLADKSGTNLTTQEGKSYVVFGKASGSAIDLSKVAVGEGGFVISGTCSGDQSGSVSSAGDVNGDGLADLIVGAFQADKSGTNLATQEGKSYVIFGRTSIDNVQLSAMASTDGFVINGACASDYSGISVSSAGDVNGDGLADLIVGAYTADKEPSTNLATQEGKSYVIFGRTGNTKVELSAMASTDGFVINGACSGDILGRSVSSAGDVNGDGLADLIVGAPVGGASPGKSFVIFGRTGNTKVELSAMASTDGFVINGAGASDQSGISVSSAGDVNGDGLADLIVGVPLADKSGTNLTTQEGKSYVVFGKASGSAIDLSKVAVGEGGFVINGACASDYSGYSVSSAGDVNGDGLADLIVGAYGADKEPGTSAGTNEGKSYVIFGATNGVFSKTVVTWMGGASNDDSINTTGTTTNVNETFVAGAGNDTITGNGGADVMYGGAGNDTFKINASNITALQSVYGLGGNTDRLSRIDGGSGADTLFIDNTGSTGLTLDLTKIANVGEGLSRLQSIEKINLNGNNNILKLSLADIQDIVGMNWMNSTTQGGFSATSSSFSSTEMLHQLVIDGSRTNEIIVTNSGFVEVGTAYMGSNTYRVYNNSAGRAQLLIQSGISTAQFDAINVITNYATSGGTTTALKDTDYYAAGVTGVIGDKASDINALIKAATSKTSFDSLTEIQAAVNSVLFSIKLSALGTAQGAGGFVINGAGASDQSGYSVSSAGDVNGDGLADLIVGTKDASGGAGKSYVIFGRAGSDAVALAASTVGSGSITDGFVINGTCASDYSGFSVSSAGDVNGDGLADLIVGAYQADPKNTTGITVANAGKSYVIFGRAGSDAVALAASTVGSGSITDGFVINGADTSDYSGYSVSSAGDVNGDGLADLIVGATRTAGFGKSYVIFGKTDKTNVELSDAVFTSGTSTNGFVINGPAYLGAGVSVSSAGDVNGDGLADLIVGAVDATYNSQGKSYVIFGKADGVKVELSDAAFTNGTSTNGFVINGACSGDQSGISVSSAGDVNGDGLADLIVGAQSADKAPNTSTTSNEGKSYVVFGKGSGSAIDLSKVAVGEGGFVINGAGTSDYSGVSVSSAGDVNGDGLADLIVGANGASKSYVVFGKSGGSAIDLSKVAVGEGGFVINGACASDYSGFSVSSAGDVNGDGLADLIVGAYTADKAPSTNTSTNEGKSYVIFGATNGVFSKTVVTSMGNASDPLRSGGSAAEFFVAGAGNDTITGNGGADVMYGGAGNDTFKINASNITALQSVYGLGGNTDRLSRIDGGSGADTLFIDNTGSTGLTLDLTKIANVGEGLSRLQSIEKINLNGNNNILKLSLADIQDIVGMNWINSATLGWTGGTYTRPSIEMLHQLVIDGSDTNEINVTNGGFNQVGTITNNGNTYRVYNNSAGRAQLLIQSGISTAQFDAINVITNYATSGGTTTALKDTDYYAAGVTGVIGDKASDINALIKAATSKTSFDSLTEIQAAVNSVLFSIKLSALGTAQGAGGFVINGACASDQSGYSVSSAGDVNGDGLADLIVGANYADKEPSTNTGTNEGKSYVIFGRTGSDAVALAVSTVGSGSITDGFVINGEFPSGQSGFSVSSAGDVNGDGLADLIVGAPEGSSSSPGKSYVIFGRAGNTKVELSAMASTDGFVINGAGASDYSGASVSSAGDVNGDGLADLIVGAPNTISSAPGKSYVIFGKTDKTSVQLSDIENATATASGFVINGGNSTVSRRGGVSVSSAGDVNGDGLADLIVGASTTLNSTGKSYVIFGKADGVKVELSDAAFTNGTSTNGFVINGATYSSTSGISVSSAGDVNGDGLADLIVGADTGDKAPNTSTTSNEGKSYVVFGKSSGSAIDLSKVAVGEGGFVINGACAGDRSGVSVSSAGDVNGDGLADLIVGANGASKSYVVFGKSGGSAIDLSKVAVGEGGFVINGACASDYSGFSVSSAGDVNGDGLADLIVGAYTADKAPSTNTSTNEGKSYVIFGATNGVFSKTVVTSMGNASDPLRSGGSAAEFFVAGAGNDTITGNGGADVMYGGAGNDTFKINASNITALQSVYGLGGNTDRLSRIDGGSGADTLFIDNTGSTGLTLDLTKIANVGEGLSRLQSIEKINLNGNNNILKLSLADIQDIVGMNWINSATLGWTGGTYTRPSIEMLHQLVIDGSDTNEINVTNGGFNQVGTITNNGNTYRVYNNSAGRAQLLIDQDISSISFGQVL